MSSRRQYIDSTYLTTYLSGEVLSSDYSNVDDLISTAEEMIDAFVGPQDRWFRIASSSNAGVFTAPDWDPRIPVPRELRGRVSAIVDPTHFNLQTYQENAYQMDFFALCFIEIIGGTGIGQTNHVTGSTLSGEITVETAWTTPIDTTSVYRIYQLGKFPRVQDAYFDGINQPFRYYKMIPDEVRRATAAQCAYMNRMGRAFFENQDANMQSEHFGNYSYSRRQKDTTPTYIAPEAVELLKRIKKRTGTVI